MSKTVMIVDDSNVIRNKISQNLASNYEVIATASNGIDAVELYKELKPDLVTMDLTMPFMNGLECINEIMMTNHEARILVVSALSDRATAIRAMKLGAQGFLVKPFTDQELLDAIEEVMN